MARIEDIARAVLSGDALQVRSLVQELGEQVTDLGTVARPRSTDEQTLVVAAAIIELLAQRAGQNAPAWTQDIGSLAEPRYLVKAADRMPHLRELCRRESPEPLRRRGLLAPPNYLSAA